MPHAAQQDDDIHSTSFDTDDLDDQSNHRSLTQSPPLPQISSPSVSPQRTRLVSFSTKLTDSVNGIQIKEEDETLLHAKISNSKRTPEVVVTDHPAFSHSNTLLLSSSAIAIDGISIIVDESHGATAAASGSNRHNIVTATDVFGMQKRQTSSTSFAQANANSWRRFQGIFCAMAAGFIFMFAAVSSSFLVRSYIAGEVGFFRFIVVPFFALPFLIIRRINPFAPALVRQCGVLLAARGLIGSLAFLLRLMTFSRLPLGDATTIFFTTPIFVGIAARIFLNERYHKTYMFAAVLALCGCVLIARPSFIFSSTTSTVDTVDSSSIDIQARLEGCAAAIASAAIAAGVFVILRRLRRVDAAVTIFYFGLGGTLTSGTWSLLMTRSLPWPGLQWQHWMWIILMGAASNVGQYFFTLSLRYENANVVALFGAADIIWAFLAQMVFFGVYPQLLSICGATLVVGSVIFVACRKILESRTPPNKRKPSATNKLMMPSDLLSTDADRKTGVLVPLADADKRLDNVDEEAEAENYSDEEGCEVAEAVALAATGDNETAAAVVTAAAVNVPVDADVEADIVVAAGDIHVNKN